MGSPNNPPRNILSNLLTLETLRIFAFIFGLVMTLVLQQNHPLLGRIIIIVAYAVICITMKNTVLSFWGKNDPTLKFNLVFFFVVSAGLMVWVGTWLVPSSATGTISAHPISFLNVTYKAQGWDVKRVDLLKASTSGIPLVPKQTLQFTSLALAIPETKTDCKIAINLSINSQKIGYTSSKDYTKGIVTWDSKEIIVESNFTPNATNSAWEIRPDWQNKSLDLDAVQICAGASTTNNTLSILLRENGEAWFEDTPNLAIAAVVYTINDGQPLLLDLTKATDTPLGAGPGDKLTLVGLWYHSNAASAIDAGFDAYVTDASRKYTSNLPTQPRTAVEEGIHKMAMAQPVAWTLTDKDQYFYVQLCRYDGPVMDTLVLPLGKPNK